MFYVGNAVTMQKAVKSSNVEQLDAALFSLLLTKTKFVSLD